MRFDKKLYVCTAVFLLPLLLVSFIGEKITQNFALAILVGIETVLLSLLLKKRTVHDFHKKQVALVMAAIATIMIALYLMTGIKYGYIKTEFKFAYLTNFFLPYGITILAAETIRSVFLAQKSKTITVVTYFLFVWIDFLILCDTNISANYDSFMAAIGFALLPALTSNFLYHYLAGKFGALPNIVYKLIIFLFPYIIPIKPDMSEALLSFLRIVMPVGIYLLIHTLYTPRTFAVAKRNTVLQAVFTTIIVIFSAIYIMLVSMQFQYKLIVIATESMSGEIDKGDAVIFEEYDKQIIQVGDVIVFNHDDNRIIHRVVDIKKINGQYRYFTKGDANESRDSGYITDTDVLGIVNLKIKYVGYPTLWLRSLFE